LCALLVLVASTGNAQPFADEVISYISGTGISTGFDDPLNALGMPALNNGTSVFMGETFDNGDVTPFNGAFLTDQLVQVGTGGELVVRFDAPVVDDPGNPFGIDLLVFGNAFFFDPVNFAPVALDIFADDGQISVSQDGDLWSDITSVFSDAVFPTSAYLDTPGPFASGGSTLSDFTLPVDPGSAWLGADFDEILALYSGSGGGAGVDLAETGLGWIQYVRVTARDGVTTEIDAFADVAAVPEPSAVLLLLTGLLVLHRSRGAHSPARDEMPTLRRARRIMWRSMPLVQ
jgi:hypothetical protein